MAKFKVRFKLDISPTKKCHPPESSKNCKKALQKHRYKSRYGCRECKQGRLKCDERYPICVRCSHRGLVCHAPAREQLWQIQLPSLSLFSQNSRAMGFNPSPHSRESIEEPLILYWLHTISRLFAPGEEDNPFAHLIIEHIYTSQSLLHAIRSISSAHQHFFEMRHLQHSLMERSRAMELLREELGTGSQSLHTLFFSVYLLGISSSFIDYDLQDFGYEHLEAARIIVNLILASETSRRHPLTRWVVGTFVYWDMSCAFLAIPTGNPSDDYAGSISNFIAEEMMDFSHPINGPCTELFYTLSILGRYISYIAAHGLHDHDLEFELETKLLTWSIPDFDAQWMWAQTAEAFRKHGLIMLYHCIRQDFDEVAGQRGTKYFANDIVPVSKADGLMRQYAVDIVICLSSIPITSNFLMIQAIPLLTAGAELAAEDLHYRTETKYRLLAMYSCTRIPANLVAVSLLDRIWQMRIRGENDTWLQVLVQENLILRIG